MRLAPALLIAALPLLSGCVVAVVPVLAGGAILKKQGDKADRKAAAPMVAAGGGPAWLKTASAPAPVKSVQAEIAVGGPLEAAVVPPVAFTLPKPAAVTPGTLLTQIPTGAYAPLVEYAVGQQAKILNGEAVVSAIIAPGTALEKPGFLACNGQPAAVLIDADSAAASGGTATDLGEDLITLRDAGVAVIWITDRAGATLRADLAASGLDGAGKDRILIATGAGEGRKQIVRQAAAREYCIVAIAGDRRSDADELYDYLREDIAAFALEKTWGAGWFLLPAPLPATITARPNLTSRNP